MHERQPNKDEEHQPTIFVAGTRRLSDGDPREAWIDAGQYVAEMERRIGWWLRRYASLAGESTGRDENEPGFVYVGNQRSLGFIAAVAAGVIEHGQAFAAWARRADGDPDTLRRFKDAFLGHWQSAEQFTEQMLDYLHRVDEAEQSAPEERRESTAKELSEELQRRGDISVIANPTGGVWIFRGR